MLLKVSLTIINNPIWAHRIMIFSFDVRSMKLQTVKRLSSRVLTGNCDAQCPPELPAGEIRIHGQVLSPSGGRFIWEWEHQPAQNYGSVCLKIQQLDQKWTTEERELFVCGAQVVQKAHKDGLGDSVLVLEWPERLKWDMIQVPLRVRQVPAGLLQKKTLRMIDVYSFEEAVFTALSLKEKCNFPASTQPNCQSHSPHI